MSKEPRKPSDETATPTEFAQAADQSQTGLFREFWDFLKESKKWWLTPIILVLILVAVLVLLGGSSAAPFIYTLF
jgi:hypothetical protein